MKDIRIIVLLIAATAWGAQVDVHAAPIGTAFTYQGQLKEGGVPANGQYDFVFRLFDAASGPAQVGSDVPINNWPVSNGLFTVELDFGVDAFSGQARWLEIAVGPPGGSLTTLAPRHKVTATPYSIQTRGIFVDENLNVGIGTDAPEGVLDVRGPNGGDIHLGVNDAGARIISTDPAGNLNLRPRVDGAGVFARDGNTNKGVLLYGGGMNAMQSVDLDGTSPFALAINPDGGNVGIGTATPGARLDVGAGDIHLDANRELFFADNGQIRSANDKHRVLFRRDENKLELREYGTIIFSAGATAGDETGSVAVRPTGNVGIGTLDPLTKQHIEGSDLSLSAASLMNEDLTIEDADAALGLYSDIGGDWGSALSFGEIDAGGNLADKWSLVRRASNSPGGSALRLTYGADPNYAANATVVHFAPNGRVGIGTPTPDAALDVNGEMIHRGAALKHLGHDLIIADAARGDGGRALVHEGDGVNERLVLNFANDFNQGTVVHGNLGIARTPRARLDVGDGDILMEMDRRLKFDAEDGRTFDVGYDSTKDSGVITAPGRNLELTTGWNERLTLKAGHGGMDFAIQTEFFDDTRMFLHSTGDLELSGDLVVHGAVRGTLGPNNGSPFPRPAYDSGWVEIAAGGTEVLEHNIGVDPYYFVVDLQCGVLIAMGKDDGDGIGWFIFNTTEIEVWAASDTMCSSVRVRIWVYK
ncbi:MAG: hypothetical protein JSU86_15780 [Phycisphaerales bacterium]|nr:MAG: hypothetical protein JSU86_15780 [Phycisphaerales bacterium]